MVFTSNHRTYTFKILENYKKKTRKFTIFYERGMFPQHALTDITNMLKLIDSFSRIVRDCITVIIGDEN